MSESKYVFLPYLSLTFFVHTTNQNCSFLYCNILHIWNFYEPLFFQLFERYFVYDFFYIVENFCKNYIQTHKLHVITKLGVSVAYVHESNMSYLCTVGEVLTYYFYRYVETQTKSRLERLENNSCQCQKQS